MVGTSGHMEDPLIVLAKVGILASLCGKVSTNLVCGENTVIWNIHGLLRLRQTSDELTLYYGHDVLKLILLVLP